MLNEQLNIPTARPFGPELEPVPVARPIDGATAEGLSAVEARQGPPPIPAHLAERVAATRTDHAAVASAVCGMSAVIPIVSQIAGLILGFLALGRIAKARRAGVVVGGRRYAMTGIISSMLALAGWVAFGVLMLGVNKTLAHTLKPLTGISALRR